MSKLQDSQLRGYKHVLAIAVIAVCVYFGFSPLFELVNGGVEGRVLGASFGAIFVLVLTMYLLNKQTEIEQESKRSEKIFEEKVTFYKTLLATVKEILEDGKIDSSELNKLRFSMIELQMLGADETIKAFTPVLYKFQYIHSSKHGDSVEISNDDQDELLLLLSKFSHKCRVDLGIDNIELDANIFQSVGEQMTQSRTKKTFRTDEEKRSIISEYDKRKGDKADWLFKHHKAYPVQISDWKKRLEKKIDKSS